MLTFLFGLVCFCTAFVKNFQSLVGMRILLGFAEGGILPGSAFYLSKFYRRYELGSRIGLLYTSTLLSGFFGGFLGAGMSQIPPFGPIHTWRNIFFFEGLIPMILAPVLWWVLPNDPSEARFLDDGQRALASKRMAEENELSGGEEGHLIKWRHIKIALGSINNWLAISVYAFSSVAPQSFVSLYNRKAFLLPWLILTLLLSFSFCRLSLLEWVTKDTWQISCLASHSSWHLSTWCSNLGYLIESNAAV